MLPSPWPLLLGTGMSPQARGIPGRDVSDTPCELVPNPLVLFFLGAGPPGELLLLHRAAQGAAGKSLRTQQIPSAVQIISIPLPPLRIWPKLLWTTSSWSLDTIRTMGDTTSGKALLGVILQCPPKCLVFHVSFSFLHLSICPNHCSMSPAASPVLCRPLLRGDHSGPVAKGRHPMRRAGVWAPAPEDTAARGCWGGCCSAAINEFTVNSSGRRGSSLENSVSYS